MGRFTQLLSLIIFLLPVSCGRSVEVTGDTTLKIAASIFPIYDIAGNIAGGYAETLLILPPGVSPHTFDPRPSDLKKMSGVDMILSVGLGLDEWVTSIAFAAAEKSELFELHGGIDLIYSGCSDCHSKGGGHSHGSYDPHYWMSIPNAERIAENIFDILSGADPENKEGYRDNLTEYLDKLRNTDGIIRDKLRDISGERIIVFHDSWNYFAREYAIEVAGRFHLNPGSEPGPRHLESLYRLAREEGVRAVFSEPQFSRTNIESLVEDEGLLFGVLNPLGGGKERESYIKNMRRNALELRRVLRGE